ncbi:MAG: hypothetical protein RIS09_1039 [Actinomycetota bacterium]|jgi:hypothetical protein
MSSFRFASRRQERRKRLISISLTALFIFLVGYGAGYLVNRPVFVPVENADPTPCITLAIFPIEFVPEPSEVEVRVLNGSKRVGVAGITGEVLDKAGFVVLEVGNLGADNIEAAAEIRYGKKSKSAALLLQAYIVNAVLIQDNRTDKSIDVVVGQGFESVRNKAEATRELNRPIPSPSGPGC